MSTPPFGSTKCRNCKGTGLDPHLDRECEFCTDGWVLPKTEESREEHRRKAEGDVDPPGRDIVLGASDAIRPVVHDNPFSQEALDKVMRSGRDKSMRRTILEDLHRYYPVGMSSSQFEEEYDWLHQSCSAALTGLHQSGLVRVIDWRINDRGNREGVYTMSPIAYGAWESA